MNLAALLFLFFADISLAIASVIIGLDSYERESSHLFDDPETFRKIESLHSI